VCICFFGTLYVDNIVDSLYVFADGASYMSELFRRFTDTLAYVHCGERKEDAFVQSLCGIE
jgi:hypothetical protein